MYKFGWKKIPETPIGSYWSNDNDPFKKMIVKVLAEKDGYVQYSMDCYKWTWTEDEKGWVKYSASCAFQEESNTKSFFLSYYKPFEEKIV